MTEPFYQMDLSIEVSTCNDAVQDHLGVAAELRRISHLLAKMADEHDFQMIEGEFNATIKTIRDVNGNNIGRLHLEIEDVS